MKHITMAAEVIGQPKYSAMFACGSEPWLARNPAHVAAHWVTAFIYQLRKSTGFHNNIVRFLLTTREGAHVHGMVQHFDEECAEDLAKFWVPVVTKYISEN